MRGGGGFDERGSRVGRPVGVELQEGKDDVLAGDMTRTLGALWRWCAAETTRIHTGNLSEIAGPYKGNDGQFGST